MLFASLNPHIGITKINNIPTTSLQMDASIKVHTQKTKCKGKIMQKNLFIELISHWRTPKSRGEPTWRFTKV